MRNIGINDIVRQTGMQTVSHSGEGSVCQNSLILEKGRIPRMGSNRRRNTRDVVNGILELLLILYFFFGNSQIMSARPNENKFRSLVELFIDGDQPAFNTLFLEYGKKLYSFSFNYLRCKEEAEEVVQEVFIKIWETRHTIDPDQSFDAYIFTIAYRIILNKLRKIRHETRYKEHVIAFNNQDLHNSVEHLVNEEETHRALRSAINGLPDKRRAIFKLIKEQHMSYRQVADHLKISVKTVEAQMTEALKYLRKRLTTWCIIIFALLSMLS